MVYDIFTETIIRAVCCGSLLEGLRLSMLKQDGHGNLYRSGRRNIIPYIHEESVVLLCV
jgi:hypothetical protein